MVLLLKHGLRRKYVSVVNMYLSICSSDILTDVFYRCLEQNFGIILVNFELIGESQGPT